MSRQFSLRSENTFYTSAGLLPVKEGNGKARQERCRDPRMDLRSPRRLVIRPDLHRAGAMSLSSSAAWRLILSHLQPGVSRLSGSRKRFTPSKEVRQFQYKANWTAKRSGLAVHMKLRRCSRRVILLMTLGMMRGSQRESGVSKAVPLS